MVYKITAFIIAEAVRPKKGKELPAEAPAKSAPHYFEKSVPAQFLLGEEKKNIDAKEVLLVVKSYHPDAILVEGSIEIEDIFSDGILELKDKLHNTCYELAKKNGGKEEPAEEYTVYQISGYKGDPELFLKSNGAKIAALLKSEKAELDEKEVEYTLSFQFKYGKDDLIVVDWDGAFIFDPDGESEETVELLELANYQLLRYRILDEDLDERLKQAVKLTQTEKRKWWQWAFGKEVSEEFREIIKVRLQSISQFEALDRDIKLIGEWYSARLYELLAKKFRFGDWHRTAQDKLDSLEDVYTTAAENLGMSRIQRLELIQILGFFILQVGWFMLIILEFWYFTK